MFSADEILYFWFKGMFPKDMPWDEKTSVWLGNRRDYDRIVRRRLLTYIVLASEGTLSDWESSPRGMLALILLQDRVARICYRGSSLKHEHDRKARKLAVRAVERCLGFHLSSLEQVFLLFPLLASERKQDQKLAFEELEKLCGDEQPEVYAFVQQLLALVDRNLLVLEKFSRFPHRAAFRGLPLKAEEQRFVDEYDWQHWL